MRRFPFTARQVLFTVLEEYDDSQNNRRIPRELCVSLLAKMERFRGQPVGILERKRLFLNKRAPRPSHSKKTCLAVNGKRRIQTYFIILKRLLRFMSFH